MATINGLVRNIVQHSMKPSWAPACEYVAIPLGSSSAAPVNRPGPGTRDIFVTIGGGRLVIGCLASAASRLALALESPSHRNWFQIRDITAIRRTPE
jgi:hypothetical protein